jgi:S-formylglutathione hydrolase FrmB
MKMKPAFSIVLLSIATCVLTCSAAAEPLPVTTVEFDAPSVGRTNMKYNIILPARYDESDERYPVLYLLHGYSDDCRGWAHMRVPEYAARYEMIVVMPDAGNSCYVNWAQSEDGQKNAWEDYMINDVIGHVDANYRTIAKREGRAINGLSVGGYGALMLGLRHPDMFCSIGSHSGTIRLAAEVRRGMESGEGWQKKKDSKPSAKSKAEYDDESTAKEVQVIEAAIGVKGFSSQEERTPKGTLFATVEDCDRYDPFELVLRIPKEGLPDIHMDCGTEDFLFKEAREFARHLQDNMVPYSYAESEGGHTGTYWAREVANSMAIQYNAIQRNLARLAK